MKTNKYSNQFSSGLTGLLMAAILIAVSHRAQSAPVTATSADGFVDSIGVNTHWSYGNVYQTSYAGLKTKLGELGIRHLRDGTTSSTFTRATDLYNTYGIRTMMLCGRRLGGPWPQPLDPTQIDQELADIKTLALAATDSIEWPNEYDISHPSSENSTWVTALLNYGHPLFTKVKADSLLRTLPVIGPSLTSEGAYTSVGNQTAYIDYSCLHHYQSDRWPGTPGWGGNGYGSITWAITYLAHVQSPSKPIQNTECGYYNAAVGDYVDERTEGLYAPRMFAEFFSRGYARSYKYELVNEGTSTTDSQQSYGLLRNDLTEKPSATALKNMIALLKQPGASFTPGSLDYTLSDPSGNSHQLLLQKSDGTFYLLLWQEISSWNPTSFVEIINPDVTVTLTVPPTITSAAWNRVNDNQTWTGATISSGNITLSVPDKIMIVRLTSTPITLPPAPTGLTATAVSSSQINLSWTASSGATSYNVKRATVSGGPYTTVATGVTSTSYSDTGLTASTTYYYVVSAVNANGESANSAQASATTLAAPPPPVPTGLTATAQKQPGRITVSWTASTGATSYNVKRATVSGGPYTTVASPTTTTYTDTGLTGGTTYYYVVSAVNAAGQSPNSTQASATSK